MKAGKLDRVIALQRATVTVNDAGTPVEAWATFATLRAQLMDGSKVEEAQRAHGASTEALAIFRTRFTAGVTVADRVSYEGQAFAIRELKELGRRRGLDIRAVRVGP